MKKIIIACVIALVVIAGYVGINTWLSYEDDPLVQAKRMYPLGKDHTYIIVKTDGMGTNTLSIPYVYAISRPGEAFSASSLAWRRIGKSAVDLNQFLRKKVAIEGEYYMSTPLLLNKPVQDVYGLSVVQPVINIENLVPVE